MRRYILTPRGRVANLVLVVLVVLGALLHATHALATGAGPWIHALLSAALLIGLLRHWPPTYALVALLNLVGLALALRVSDAQMVLTYALVVVLAMFTRSQMLERVDPPPA